MSSPDVWPRLVFGTPRKLPHPSALEGRVVVLDIAFAAEGMGTPFEEVTGPFLEGLGDRLALWVDHHDHDYHARFRGDPRFVLATKAEHGACPEMITPDLVERIGVVDTVVCHTDFDGLASAAKWIRQGVEPYAGCDDDARAIDTRIGTPSSPAERMDRALRARPHDAGLFGVIVRHLANGLEDAALWVPIQAAADELVPIERETRRAAQGFQRFNLGMAPLSGLKPGPLAPIWSRLGAAVYGHGERIYGFSGLRSFKQKFGPAWVPRYIGTTPGVSVPRALIDAAVLIGG